ncbi:hypothetical protein F2Q69_00015032 [Brassica cretica]|uniref:Uncharacterized protein n=1 Tax=Brassica cretica TaxID=69181 RepID=A0A8S9QS95_BRACR|nr:hypothetical protein F2Q69_00015032 [Brassica cretica]
MMKRTRRSLKSKGFRGQVMIRRYSGRWGGDGGEEKFRGMMLVDRLKGEVGIDEGFKRGASLIGDGDTKGWGFVSWDLRLRDGSLRVLMRGRCRFLVGGKRGDRASNRARLCVSSSLGEMEAKGEVPPDPETVATEDAKGVGVAVGTSIGVVERELELTVGAVKGELDPAEEIRGDFNRPRVVFGDLEAGELGGVKRVRERGVVRVRVGRVRRDEAAVFTSGEKLRIEGGSTVAGEPGVLSHFSIFGSEEIVFE